MNNKLIKRLKDDPHFKEFQEFITSEIVALTDIQDLLKMSNKKAGETVRVRAQSIVFLQKILQPFTDFNEKKEPSAKEVQAAKDKVGL